MLIFFEAINRGSHDKMIRDVVEMYTGYIQIQEKGYKAYPDMDHFIHNISAINSAISQQFPNQKTVSRIEVPALFSSEEQAYGGIIVGVEPNNEPRISRLSNQVEIGRFIQVSDTIEVCIGKDLAKKLSVSINDSLAVLSTSYDRSMVAEVLKVVGIFETNLFGSDGQMVIMNKNYMDRIFYTQDMASYLIVELPKGTELYHAETIKNDLAPLLPVNLDIFTWRELLTSFVNFVEMDESMSYLSIVVLVLVVFFVIMIFQLISVNGRTKELGMMLAMGTPVINIIAIFVIEMMILLGIGLPIGVSMGAGISYWFEQYPIELQFSDDIAELYQQFGMIEMVIPADLTIGSIVFGVGVVLIIYLAALIIPIRYIYKLKPKEAMADR